MKRCTCGAMKWRGTLSLDFTCLKCYKKYNRVEFKKLSDPQIEAEKKRLSRETKKLGRD